MSQPDAEVGDRFVRDGREAVHRALGRVEQLVRAPMRQQREVALSEAAHLVARPHDAVTLSREVEDRALAAHDPHPPRGRQGAPDVAAVADPEVPEDLQHGVERGHAVT